MKNILISVIVPVYNVEKYVEKCIESILNQSYKNFELLLVDDKSTDSSGKICDEIALKDDRIKVFHLDKNQGLSNARNFGMGKAKGDYYVFVDSDDFVGIDYLKLLVKQVADGQAEMGIVEFKTVFDFDDILKENENDKTAKQIFYTPEDCLLEMLKGKKFGVSACAKIYKKSLFNNIKYPYGKIYEDTDTTPYLLENCEKISFIASAQYFYRKQTESITHQKITLDSLEKNMYILDVVNKLVKYVNDLYPDLHKAAIKRFIECNFWVLQRLALSNDNNVYKYMEKLANNHREYWKEYLFNPYLAKSRKIFTFFLLISPKLYKWAWTRTVLISPKMKRIWPKMYERVYLNYKGFYDQLKKK